MTAKKGELSNSHLRDCRDNEETTPTILTISQKLSTGVDARNVRSIVLLRPMKSMIEFKQIIESGTRRSTYSTSYIMSPTSYHRWTAFYGLR